MTDHPAAVHGRAGQNPANLAFGLSRRFHARGTDTGGAVTVWEEKAPAGVGPPLHVHHGQTEVFTMLTGRVRFRAGDAEFEAGPGDTCTIPAGLPHAFKAVADASFVICLTPGGGEAFFEEVAAQGLSAPADMARIAEIAARNGLEFVGPPLD